MDLEKFMLELKPLLNEHQFMIYVGPHTDESIGVRAIFNLNSGTEFMAMLAQMFLEYFYKIEKINSI